MASTPGFVKTSVSSSACEYCTDEGCDAVNCKRCLQVFGLFTRRHHCRGCGGAFCAQCSNKKLRLPDQGFVFPVRVCDRCFIDNSLEGIWERETLTARHFLRMQEDKYRLDAPLHESCRRVSPVKSLWLAKGPNKSHVVLMSMSAGPGCTLKLADAEEGNTLATLLRTLKHPFVWPTLAVEFMMEKQRLILVRPFSSRGSIRDRIYRSSAKAAYGEKYQQGGGRGLPVAEIGRFGRQVLEAVNYLLSRGLRAAHLHSGNVIIEGGNCYVTELIELELLGQTLAPSCGLPPEASAEQGAVLAFGRLLLEMAFGRRMQPWEAVPLELAAGAPRSGVAPAVLDVLRSILGRTVRLSDLPSIQDLLENMLFSSVKLVADVRFITQQPPQGAAASMLRRSRRAALIVELPKNVPSADETPAPAEERGDADIGASPSGGESSTWLTRKELSEGSLPATGSSESERIQEKKKKKKKKKKAHSRKPSLTDDGESSDFPGAAYDAPLLLGQESTDGTVAAAAGSGSSEAEGPLFTPLDDSSTTGPMVEEEEEPEGEDSMFSSLFGSGQQDIVSPLKPT